MQHKRAVEMAREAGLDPFAEVESKSCGQYQKVYEFFKQAAWDEHFAANADANNILWKERHSEHWYYDHGGDECTFSYGRCRSGKRWFWHIFGWQWGRINLEEYLDAHGWTDTEEQARTDGYEAIKRLAAGRPVVAYDNHQGASQKLKGINTDRRAARAAADGSDSKTVEYLYGRSSDEYRIIKKTKNRIFFDASPTWSSEERIGFIDRQKFEQAGEEGIFYRDKYVGGFRLFATKPLPRSDHKPKTVDLLKLKAEMAAAHPDKGGTSAAFIEARKRYIDARRAARLPGGAA